MEAAAEIAAGNEKGLLLYRDELAGWWRSFNRYGGDGERQFWLQAYGARAYTVDRKKAGKPITVRRLAISVVGGVQPEVLSTLLDGEADGFAARLLYAYPDPTAGFRLASTPVDFAGARTALSRLHGLKLVDDGLLERRPFVCNITADAARIFERWWSGQKAAAGLEAGLWGGWLGKQGGQALRIALVLEHLWWCSNSANSANSFPREITIKAIEDAILLIDGWAASMAKRAFGASAISATEADTVALARWLKRTNTNSFNTRQLQRSREGPGGRLAKSEHMSAACRGLVDAGLVRHVGARAGETRGRSKLDYMVNPILLDGP
jgi:hypothetical protein